VVVEKWIFFSDELIDASSRKIALDLMLTGIKNNKFDDRKYGLAFWTDIKPPDLLVHKCLTGHPSCAKFLTSYP
jgi:hypothetical protein